MKSTLIRSKKRFPAKHPTGKQAILLCGFFGAVWQTKRLITLLNKKGYDVTALDFRVDVLKRGDPRLLPELVDEVVAFAENEARKTEDKILLVGISLGALLSLNIVRRSPLYDHAVLITGGDIVKVAQKIYGTKAWPQSYETLARTWSDVNMYTEPKLLSGKRLIFVLPARDKLIDTTDVLKEVNRQLAAGNQLVLVQRGMFGHVGTIIAETVLFPKRVLQYIKSVERAA